MMQLASKLAASFVNPFKFFSVNLENCQIRSTPIFLPRPPSLNSLRICCGTKRWRLSQEPEYQQPAEFQLLEEKEDCTQRSSNGKEKSMSLNSSLLLSSSRSILPLFGSGWIKYIKWQFHANPILFISYLIALRKLWQPKVEL